MNSSVQQERSGYKAQLFKIKNVVNERDVNISDVLYAKTPPCFRFFFFFFFFFFVAFPLPRCVLVIRIIVGQWPIVNQPINCSAKNALNSQVLGIQNL